MNKLTIKTNNQPRNLIYGYELTDSEKQEFDYVDDIDSHDFFRYKGIVYDPSEFMVMPRVDSPFYCPLSDWQGYQGDSYFSGLLIRYTDDMEQLVVGRYYQ